MNRLQNETIWQITKPKPNMNNYVYAGSLSVLGLAIGGYLLYSKFKKQNKT